MLLHLPQYFERVIESVGPDSFRDSALRAIFGAMAKHGADARADVLAAELDTEAIAQMQELLEERGGLENADATVAGTLTSIRAEAIRERLEELQGMLEIAGPDQKDELLREKNALAREQRLLGGGQHWAAVQGRESRGSR